MGTSSRFAFPHAAALILAIFWGSGLLAADQGWIELRSPHFRVLTDSDEAHAKDVAFRFEQMRAIYGVLLQQNKANLPKPVEIYAFRTPEGFVPNAPANSKQTSLLFRSPDRDIIVIDLSSADAFSSAAHDFAHLLLEGNFPPIPAWFREGFSDYFSGLRAGTKTVEFAIPSEKPLATISTGKWIAIEDLFGAMVSDQAALEANRRIMFHAESWLVMQWILANQKLPAAVSYLQKAHRERVPVPQAINEAFGMTPEQLDQTIRSFATAPSVPYSLATPVVENGPYEKHSFNSLQSRAILADLHARSPGRAEQALAEFTTISATDPKSIVVNRGLAYCYIATNDFDQAAQILRRAVDREPSDPSAHYLLALAENRKMEVSTRPPADLEEMIQTARISLSLNPTLADAYRVLAEAQAANFDFSPATESSLKAIEAAPGDENYQLSLADIYSRGRSWEKAKVIFDFLQGSSDPQIVAKAVAGLASMATAREKLGVSVRNAVPSRPVTEDDLTAPQWRRKGSLPSETANSSEVNAAPDTRKVKFLYGRLVQSDCSQDPVAVITIQSEGKRLRMRSEDYKNMIVLGADSFECAWKDRNVLVNYKAGGKNDGDVVTLELR